MLRSVWQAYSDGEATCGDVLGVLDHVCGFIDFEMETLRQQALEGISDMEDPLFNQIVEAFELHAEANEIMAEEFAHNPEVQARPGQIFRVGFQMAQRATQQLADAHRSAMDNIEAMANVACIFCSHSNPRERERCAKCGRSLPGAASGPSFSMVNAEGLEGCSSNPPGEVTENYAVVAEAARKWLGGLIQTEPLLGVVDDVEERLAGHQSETPQYREEIKRAPGRAQGALSEALSMTEDGLASSLAALDALRAAIEKSDGGEVAAALQDLERASNLMVRAYHASREAAAQAR